jgi:hypothetical protein
LLESIKASRTSNHHERVTDSIKVSANTILEIERKIDSTQNKMDTTLVRVGSVQTQVVGLQTEIDDFIHVTANREDEYKKQRMEDAKGVCFAELHIAMDRVFRLGNFYYYTKPEFRWKARDDLNSVYYLLVNMQANLYLSTNPELKKIVLQLKNIVDSKRRSINAYDKIPEDLAQIKDTFQAFQEAVYPIIGKYEHPLRYRHEFKPR